MSSVQKGFDFILYKNIVEGIFFSRPNRFIAQVYIDGVLETVHVKNTGRCKELLVSGAVVYLEKSDNLSRKTRYSLISVIKDGKLFNIDSQVPNDVVFESLKSNSIKGIIAQNVKREVTFGSSRIDLFFNNGFKDCFMEVKGVTLESCGIASFPDAPTIRGVKHLNELILAKEAGFQCYIMFLIQFNGAQSFKSNDITDILFAQTLLNAQNSGVNILAYDSIVTPTSIIINKPIKILI